MDEDAVALQSLSTLESRLRRIEFALVGDTYNTAELLQAAKNSNRDHSISARLMALEAALSRLSIKSKTVHDILELHASYPEIFVSSLPASSDHPTSSLSPEEQLATLISVAPSFHTTSSQLVSLKDSPIPAPNLSADLIALQPRLDKAMVTQESQARQVAELRNQSIRILERWYLVGIEGVNECFAEWDDRIRSVDKILLARKARELE